MSDKCVRCGGSGVEPREELSLFEPRLSGASFAFRDDPPKEWPTTAAFDEFWQLYDKTGPRKKAQQCFEAAVKRGNTCEQIVDGLRKWVWYWKQPGSAAMKWPQGFLNQEYFNDEPPAVRTEVVRKAMPGRGGIEAALAARTQRQIGAGS